MLPSVIRDAENKLGVLDGVIIFAAASALFRFSQDLQEQYLFPNAPSKSLWASAVIGISLLMLRRKDLSSIIE
tara:strand:+ start:4888 stop:5106 length:219 start_codon:yes stop_codon:yes gene_type:complete